MEHKGALLTGYSGFLGSKLSPELVKFYNTKELDVIGADRSFFADDSWIKYEPFFEYVYNLAAAGSKKGDYSRNEIFNTNVVQTFRLLEWAKDHTDTFVHIGTSSEYGKQVRTMTEDMQLRPDFLYAATKAAATMLVREWSVTNDKRAIVFRPFSVYGEGMQETKLIPVVINKLRNNEPVRIVDGEHDFVHIDDVTRALLEVPRHPRVFEDGNFQVFNIGSGESISNEMLVRLIGKIMGVEPRIEHVQEIPGHVHFQVDSPRWQSNVSRIAHYGWRPRIRLEEGLRRMING